MCGDGSTEATTAAWPCHLQGFLFCCSGWPSFVVKLPAALLPAAAQPTPKAMLQLVFEHWDSFPQNLSKDQGCFRLGIVSAEESNQLFPSIENRFAFASLSITPLATKQCLANNRLLLITMKLFFCAICHLYSSSKNVLGTPLVASTVYWDHSKQIVLEMFLFTWA